MSSIELPTMPPSTEIDDLITALCKTCDVTRITREEHKSGAPNKANQDDLKTVISAIYSILRVMVEKDNEKNERIAKLEAEIKDLKADVEARRKANSSYASIVKESSVASTTDTHKIINAVVADLNNRKVRENNIVVFGVPVSDNGNDNSAKDTVKEVLSTVGVDSVKIGEMYRLKSKSSTKPPPIVVQLPSREDRNEALKRSKNLRSENRFDGVYINPDLTWAERVEAKELRQKRNDMNKELEEKSKNSGEKLDYHFVVRHGKVVKSKHAAFEANHQEEKEENKH